MKTSSLILTLAQTAIGIIFSWKSTGVAKFGNNQRFDHKIMSRQHLGWRSAVWPWLFITTWKSIEMSFLKGHPLYQVWQLTSKGVKKYCAENICTKTSFLHWPCDLKINRGYPFPRGIHYIKLGNFQAKRSRYLANNNIFKDQQFDLVFDSKINRSCTQYGHLVSIDIE